MKKKLDSERKAIDPAIYAKHSAAKNKYFRVETDKKQTAVQWLIENAKGFHTAESSKAMCKKALEMEREQMLAAAIVGSRGHSFDYYYTKTYQNEKENIKLPNQVASS